MNTWFIIITFNPKAGELEHLCKALQGKNLKIVENTPKKNLGYAGGANEGIKYALGKGAGWVVIVNQDLSVTAGAVGDFCRRLEKVSPGVAGPFAGSLDKKRWTTLMEKEEKTGSPIGSGMTSDLYISGSFIAIHRQVFEEVGLFYEPYFMYYEDADLCVRAKKAGFKLTYLPIKNIAHEESTSLGRGSFKHEYYLARNHLLFMERNAPASVKLQEILRMPKTLFEDYGKGNGGALRGIGDYALRRFGECKQS